MTEAKQDRLAHFTAPTAELEAVISPDKLEDVLSSLLFRRVIVSYLITQDVTRVTMKVGRSMTLMAALMARQEET